MSGVLVLGTTSAGMVGVYAQAAGSRPVQASTISALLSRPLPALPRPPPPQMPESRVPGVAAAPALTGPVYIKYNSASGLCYATLYDGRDRGVLVQLGQRQLGHMPLGLHDEQMARPAPTLS